MNRDVQLASAICNKTQEILVNLPLKTEDEDKLQVMGDTMNFFITQRNWKRVLNEARRTHEYVLLLAAKIG